MNNRRFSPETRNGPVVIQIPCCPAILLMSFKSPLYPNVQDAWNWFSCSPMAMLSLAGQDVLQWTYCPPMHPCLLIFPLSLKDPLTAVSKWPHYCRRLLHGVFNKNILKGKFNNRCTSRLFSIQTSQHRHYKSLIRLSPSVHNASVIDKFLLKLENSSVNPPRLGQETLKYNYSFFSCNA